MGPKAEVKTTNLGARFYPEKAARERVIVLPLHLVTLEPAFDPTADIGLIFLV
jgi:hypothetical protein